MPRRASGTLAPHGTLTRYFTQRCRCDVCREAGSRYKRERYGQRTRAQYLAELAARRRHGTETMYVWHGCRCDACRAAARAARRARRARAAA